MKRYYEYISVSDHICCEQKFVDEKLKSFEVPCPECDGVLTFPKNQFGLAALYCINAPACKVVMYVNQMMLNDLIRTFIHGKKINWIDRETSNFKWN